MNITSRKLINLIKKNLTPDLLSSKWKNSQGVEGHCYVATESLYYLLKILFPDRKYKPKVLSHRTWPNGLHKGETHWFLEGTDGKILDPTKEQFNIPIKYKLSIGCGFLTNKPSKRAKKVIDNVMNKIYDEIYNLP